MNSLNNTQLCDICKKEVATCTCEYVNGVSFDFKNEGTVESILCNKPLCDKCKKYFNNKFYCKEHFNKVKKLNI